MRYLIKNATTILVIIEAPALDAARQRSASYRPNAFGLPFHARHREPFVMAVRRSKLQGTMDRDLVLIQVFPI